MKIFQLLAVAGVVFLAACSGTPDQPKVPGMTLLDLTPYNRALTILIPDSTNGTPEVATQSWGATEIKVGKNFQISIKDGEGDMNLKKSDLQGDPVQKLVKIHIDEPTTILYETQIEGMPPAFRFYSIVKVGNDSFEIEDIPNGEAYSRKNVDKMLESVKTLKAAEPKS